MKLTKISLDELDRTLVNGSSPLYLVHATNWVPFLSRLYQGYHRPDRLSSGITSDSYCFSSIATAYYGDVPLNTVIEIYRVDYDYIFEPLS